MVLLITFAAFVEPARALFLGGLGVGLALLVTLVFIFDQPFSGIYRSHPIPWSECLR